MIEVKILPENNTINPTKKASQLKNERGLDYGSPKSIGEEKYWKEAVDAWNYTVHVLWGRRRNVQRKI